MGAIRDAIDTAFRDFATEGVPATGPHDPIKSEIRTAGAIIEQLLSVAGIGDTIYETTGAGISGTTNGELFLVKGDGTETFAVLYKNVSGVATAQNISLPSTVFVEGLADAALAEAANRLEIVGGPSVQMVSNSTDDDIVMLNNLGGSIQDVRAETHYMVSGLGTLTKGKVMDATGAEVVVAGGNYLNYLIDGADEEIRVTSALSYDAGVVPTVLFLNGSNVVVGTYKLSVGSGTTLFTLGETLELPSGTVRIKVSGNGAWPIDITAKRALDVPHIRFSSDSFGGARQDYIARVQPNAAPVLAAPEAWDAFISYGQSWESDHRSPSRGTMANFRGDGRALALRRVNGYSELLPEIGVDIWPAYAADVGNVFSDSIMEFTQGPEGDGAKLNWVTCTSFIYHCQQAGLPVRNALSFGAPYPGVQMDKLLPGGAIVDGGNTWQPWDTLLDFRDKADDIAETYGKVISPRAMMVTHAAYLDGETDGDGVTDYYDALQNLKDAVDAEDFIGGGAILPLFIDETPAKGDMTKLMENSFRQMDFALANPGEVIFTGPRYPYPFIDNLHHTGDGYYRIGWLRGYIAYLVLARAVTWEPFRITSAAMDSGDILVTLSRPPGFGAVRIETSGLVPAQLQNGFRLRRSGSDIALSNFRVDRHYIRITPASAMTTGDEFSYAYRSGAAGQAGTVDGGGYSITEGWSGVRGNVKRIGPPSPAFPGETADLWLAAYKATIA